jgi:ribosome biogenesis protein MAK21
LLSNIAMDQPLIGSLAVRATTEATSHDYDPTAREPKGAHAGSSALFEVLLLQHHFHPSVQAFSTALATPPNHEIRYQGDPLVDMSLMQFLDKIVYKQPKLAPRKAG